MESNNKKGWSIDITSKNVTHYYENGLSLCKRKEAQPFMNRFHDEKDYTQVLGSVCTICYKKLNK